jgi:cysteine-rich repeat protein
VCGDGLVVGAEGCDDQNQVSSDGCSSACEEEVGYTCSGAPSACDEVCGDGLVVGAEGCDDQNQVSSDGCSPTCAIELGYACSGEPSACGPICGDGVIRGSEGCDDGDTMSLDGCSASCMQEAGYACASQPSVCVATCGDGVVAVGTEQCDDGAKIAGDCCSATCQLEAAGCEAEPNNTIAQANDFAVLSVAGVMKAFIRPATDVDMFRVTVPPSGIGDLTAESVDSAFGSTCAANQIDTKIAIRDAVGAVLASDDDAGPGLCSIASITGLPAGDYFVEVIDSPAAPALSFDYSLKITLKVAVCGNGAKEGLEQCDDGNTMSGDGCSPVCLFELESEDEAGGNNTCADTSGPYSPPVIVAGAITPIGDHDYFAFTVPAVADVRVETFGPAGPGSCAAPIDTRVELRAQDCASVLVADDDDGIGACSLINPATDPAARHLAPGTYFVRVEELGNNAEILPGYSAFISFTALCGNGVKEGSEECDAASLPTATCDASCDRIPTCGDMFLDAPETCDDGNAASGDGCSATCQVEGVIAEVEPNGTLGEAMGAPISITGDTFVTGSVGIVGDKDYFKLVLSQPAVVRFETFDSSFIDCAAGLATTLKLFSSGGAQLYVNDLSGIGACSAIVVRLAVGTYYVQVEEFGNNAAVAGYALEVDFQVDVGSEVEGNDGLINATQVSGSDVVISGIHQVNADVDFFAVTVPDSWSLRAEVIEGSPAETCESGGIDSHLTLFDAAGLQLAIADDGGRGFCSLLDGTGSAPLYSAAHALAAGTYFLRVQASPFAQMGPAGQFDYRLAITLRAP